MRGLLRLGTVGLHFCLASGDRLGQKTLDQADKLAPLRNWKSVSVRSASNKSLCWLYRGLMIASSSRGRFPVAGG